jgi:RNA polymerase sigma-70 factor (ECF subfamily)
MSVTVAGLTVTLGPSAAPAMSDATFDAETTRLAVRAREGDRDAFSALVELHERAARRVAIAALGQEAEAEEAVQEACLTAWRRVNRLEDPAAFRSWFLRITWRKALDRRRSLRSWFKRVEMDAGLSDPTDAIPSSAIAADEALLTRERDQAIARMIRTLPSRLRDPFLLATTGEHRYEDIAQMLGIPLGTVKWRMLEARRMLREKLARIGFGAE